MGPIVVSNLHSNFTITEQNGCNFAGINNWANGDFGSTEWLAGTIVTQPNDDGSVAMIITEVGEAPEGVTSSSSGITASLSADRERMQWLYTGRGVRKRLGDGTTIHWVTSFEANFNPDIAPLQPLNRNKCADFSGTWYSIPHTVYKVKSNGDEIAYPGTESKLELTQDGCFVSGTHSHKSEEEWIFIENNTDFVIGVVDTKTSILTLHENYQYNDEEGKGEIRISFLGDDHDQGNNILDMHYVGIGTGKMTSSVETIAFDTVLSKETIPNLDDSHHQCNVDLIGLWNSVGTMYYSQVDMNGDVSNGETDDIVSWNIDGQSEDKCEFWGKDDVGSMIIGYVIPGKEESEMVIGTATDDITFVKRYAYINDDGMIVASSVGVSENDTNLFSKTIGTTGTVVFQKVDADEESVNKVDADEESEKSISAKVASFIVDADEESVNKVDADEESEKSVSAKVASFIKNLFN